MAILGFLPHFITHHLGMFLHMVRFLMSDDNDGDDDGRGDDDDDDDDNDDT